MDYTEFTEFMDHILTSIEDEFKNNYIPQETKNKLIPTVKVFLDNCVSIFKVFPNYNLPLNRLSVNYDPYILLIEFNIFTFLDLCVLGAYTSTIKTFRDSDIARNLEDALIFNVAATNQYGDDITTRAFNIWTVLNTEFTIVNIKDDKIKILSSTGEKFVELISKVS